MFRRFPIDKSRFSDFVRFASSNSYNAAIMGLKKDLKQSMLVKDELKKTTIRNILSAIKNKEIENQNKKPLNEFTLFDLYSKLINQREDSIKQFLENKRNDLIEKEQKEMEVLKFYRSTLPVASKGEIDFKVLHLLKDLKEKKPNLQLKQTFAKIDWKTVPSKWKASPNAIRASIVQQFKNVF